MSRYSMELKASVLKRMMPPQSRSVAALSRTIESDLLQLLGENDVPERLEPTNRVLM